MGIVGVAHASSRHVHKLQIVVVVVAVVIILGHAFMIALMCRLYRLITYTTRVPNGVEVMPKSTIAQSQLKKFSIAIV